jgi:two-component system NarL family response regulator
MSIRVIIADDHPLVREGLRRTIERSGADIVVVAEAADGTEALKAARTWRVDVFILDITMPRLNGFAAAQGLMLKDPSAKVIMLSLHDTKVVVEEALASGARGFLTKDSATKDVVAAITEVHEGRTYFSAAIAGFARKAPPAGERRSGAAALTRQEQRVLQLIGEGNTNKGIARLLNVSTNTIHSHRNSVMAKLNIHKHADLVRYAIKAGLAKL